MNDFFDHHIAAKSTTASVDNDAVERQPGTIPTAPPDTGYTPEDIRAAVQELLKYGLLEAERKPNLYQSTITFAPQIDAILEPLDLRLQIDEIRGLAFVMVKQGSLAGSTDIQSDTGQADSDDSSDWQHPLVRRQRLTLEQSLLVAILRQIYLAHEQEAGIGAGNAVVSIDELISHTELYFTATGSDARDQKRVRNLLENIRAHGIVSEVDDKDQVNIRPIITHLASPEALDELLRYLKAASNT